MRHKIRAASGYEPLLREPPVEVSDCSGSFIGCSCFPVQLRLDDRAVPVARLDISGDRAGSQLVRLRRDARLRVAAGCDRPISALRHVEQNRRQYLARFDRIGNQPWFEERR